LDRDLSQDLNNRLSKLSRRSVRTRLLTLTLFGVTVAVTFILVNITIRRLILRPLTFAQLELARERDLLRILLDHIPDSIYLKDADRKFIRVNQAAAATLGIDEPETARGRSVTDFLDPDTATRIQMDDRRILASGTPAVSRVFEAPS
jgi:PAS domain-containing protein